MSEQLQCDITALACGTRKGPEDNTLLSEHQSLQTTGTAPPFRAPLHPVRPGPLTGRPAPGERLGDFELLGVLGTGSFAQVFLARQVSLNRLVALKVSANDRQEGLTMARLEHDHIVQVFSVGSRQTAGEIHIIEVIQPTDGRALVVRCDCPAERHCWHQVHVLRALNGEVPFYRTPERPLNITKQLAGATLPDLSADDLFGAA